jgi:hypothetical protein
MSFDPYDCIELRWGGAGEERASCPEGPEKLRWYEDEQRLRNQIDRTYDISMDFSRDDLERHRKGSGVDDAPSVDVKALIDGMGDQVPFTGMTPIGR